jgi:hypothetical protein
MPMLSCRECCALLERLATEERRLGRHRLDFAGSRFRQLWPLWAETAAAWLFPRIWLAMAGAEKKDIPTF